MEMFKEILIKHKTHYFRDLYDDVPVAEKVFREVLKKMKESTEEKYLIF